jgi:hypothetical protein
MDDIERSIDKMVVTSTAALDARILNEAFSVFEESVGSECSGDTFLLLYRNSTFSGAGRSSTDYKDSVRGERDNDDGWCR